MIRDPLTGEGVLLGSTRSGRPNEFRSGPPAQCAFCPGNEYLTPPEIARVASEDGGWSARAFQNLFPAIEPPEGVHEVIVDSPGHDDEITPEGTQLWRARYRAALQHAPGAFPVLFKNRGAYAGATIVHPHTQLIVLPVRPDRWSGMISAGECASCLQLAQARERGTLVAERRGADAFVRAGSRFAFALTILPHACVPSLLDDDAAWEASVAMLSEATEALVAALGQACAFNVLVYSDPRERRFHWNIELVPRLNTLAGFELSTGMFIRGALAQESAGAWRRILGPSDGSL